MVEVPTLIRSTDRALAEAPILDPQQAQGLSIGKGLESDAPLAENSIRFGKRHCKILRAGRLPAARNQRKRQGGGRAGSSPSGCLS